MGRHSYADIEWHTKMPATRYRFGPFVLDPAIRQVTREGTPITLPPKAFDILVLLLRSRDRVIPKQELLDTLWPDTAVIENTLTQRIKEIREALGDVAQEPRWIKTVSRVGYRFIGDVVEESPAPATAVSARPEPVVTSPEGQPGFRRRLVYGVALFGVAVSVFAAWSLWPASSPSAPTERRIGSIAVLPLENLSQDPEQEYFADGMTDELITELARIPALRVISRTSVVPYKDSKKSLREIGRELNVDAVVEGSVLRADQQARITLKLVDVASDRTLLAESYARELRDVLALQSLIARALADRVRVTVSVRDEGRLRRRVDPEAYDDYLRGRSLWNTRTRDGVTRALALFRRAIDRDPTYAAAWAGVADCYIVFSGALLGISEQMAYSKAREAALQALALDETLAEAHTALGSIKNEFDWDWPGAEAEYTRAIALNSSYSTARQWYGEFLGFRGRHEESITQLRAARELDPLSPVVNNSLAIALMTARRYDQALAQVQSTLEIDPAFGGAYLTLGSIHVETGRHADAIAALERAVALTPGLSRARAWLGHAHAVAGHRDQARRTLAELDGIAKQIPVSPYDIALIHVALGDSDEAFAWLDRAYRERAWDLVKLSVDRRFEGLSNDARFLALLRRVGTPPPTRQPL